MNRTMTDAVNLNEAAKFYRDSMQLIQREGVPFMVGGAFAMALYTGIARNTKDFDLLVRASDVDLTLEVFRRHGYRTEKTHPHWLAKAFHGGNGLCEGGDSWVARAPTNEVLGVAAKVCAPEEMIWMKAYIMERERYDGADVVHLLLSCAERIDWPHLIQRFGRDWRVLLSHLVLLGFIYPSERNRIPSAVVDELMKKMRTEGDTAASERVCQGTLLSRPQYLHDVREEGFRDARLDERCRMTKAEMDEWTALRPRE